MGKLVSLKINNKIKPLYDIEVKDNHNFVVNDGMVIKNSEQMLSPDSCCVLSSLNAGRFSIKEEEYRQELSRIGPSINRFLDDVNQYELDNHTYATPNQRLAIQKLRRTGAGYTNLGEWLFNQNLSYGTPEANAAVEEFTKWYNYFMYKSSIELGKEKGNFGLFNRAKFEKSPFVQRMMGLGLEFTHMRNVTCSSIAPTGTLSLMFRDCVMSYGGEPAFGLYYWKRTRISGKYEYYFCVPHAVRKLFASKCLPIPMNSDTVKDTWDGQIGGPIAKFIDDNIKSLGISFKGATEVSPFDKLDMMAGMMKWIDSSISITYMLPEGTDWKDVYEFIRLAHKKEVKSIAAFPDKKMYGIVSFIPFLPLAEKLIKEGVEIHEQNFSEEERKHLKLLKQKKLQTNNATKREKSLPCDIHYAARSGKNYMILVGKFDNEPYEVFVCEVDGHKHKGKEGEIIKVKRGVYQLAVDGETVMENISDHLTDEEAAITRLVSTNLRHRIPVNFTCQQLEKVNGHMFTFSKVLARVLKKYIPDGKEVKGMICPSCKQENTLCYSEGCISCICGWSKCA